MFYNSKTKLYYSEGQAFVLDEVQYPGNWLTLAPTRDREALGFEPVVKVGKADSTDTHFVTEEMVGAECRIINTPKPAEMIASHEAFVKSGVRDRFTKVRSIALDRLTGIAARAVWKKDDALAASCYAAQETLLDMTKDLPEDSKGYKEILVARYTALQESASETVSSTLPAFRG